MLTLTRRAEVAAALQAAAPDALSGEALAHDLGISRAAVSNHVAALRELGYHIESAPRAGYRLIAAPDACLPEEVGPLLGDLLWTSCEGGAESPSTNDEAKRLARLGSPEGALVVAGAQTGGRGRFGREWESPPGGVYASFVLRPALPPAAIAPLSPVIALGAARGLRALGVPVGLKWPNDLLLEGRKLGGILLEMSAEADRVEWLVAGIGINMSDPGADGTAWVRHSLPHASCPAVAAAVLDSVAAAYRDFLAEGFGALRAEYESMLTLIGADVVVSAATGAVVASGAVRGVDDTGALLVEGAVGVTPVSAGEVTLRR